jgi:hypothetical protein
MHEHRIIFPEFYDDLAAFEIESKGYLDGVTVEFNDGACYDLCFRDSWNVQLDHDFTDTTSAGARYLALPNLVVIEKVSRTNIIDAVAMLAESDFFERLGLRR